MVGLLYAGSRKFGVAVRLDDRCRARLPRIVLASLLMGGLLWLANLALGEWLYTAGVRYLALAVLIAVGMLGYGAIGQAVGAFRLAEFRAALRRR
jgi:putative peptidoglycan lipid II flippase